jgi:hypothetical protein
MSTITAGLGRFPWFDSQALALDGSDAPSANETQPVSHFERRQNYIASCEFVPKMETLGSGRVTTKSFCNKVPSNQ